MTSHAARKRTSALVVQHHQSGRVPFKQSEVPRKRQRTERDLQATQSHPAPSMPLFTFTRTLRDALPPNENTGSREPLFSSSNAVPDEGTTYDPDEELEGMLPNPSASGKVCVGLPRLTETDSA
jgi:hypothetical protein